MSRIHPECPDSDPSDRSVAADAFLRQEPDEDEDEEEDEGGSKEGDDERQRRRLLGSTGPADRDALKPSLINSVPGKNQTQEPL